MPYKPFEPVGRLLPPSDSETNRAFSEITRAGSLLGPGVVAGGGFLNLVPPERDGLVLALIKGRSSDTPYRYEWAPARVDASRAVVDREAGGYGGYLDALGNWNQPAVDPTDAGGASPRAAGDVVWLQWDETSRSWLVVGTAAAAESFLVTLTAKDLSGPFVAYSWTEVVASQVLSNPADPNSPKTIVYTLAARTGGPGNFPVYSEQNVDLVVCSAGSASGSGMSGSGAPIVGGGACYCAGRVASAVVSGGTTTWTFDVLQCCEDQTLDPATGDCAPCTSTAPCPGAPLVVVAATGTYPTTPGRWAQLGTVCHAGGDETPPDCVVRVRKGRGPWYFVDHEPRWELVEITAGSGGSYTGFLLGYDQITGQVFHYEACIILDANALP